MGLWRNIFGPSQVEVWSEFAQSMGGTFVKGGWFSTHVVTWPHKEWTITLDTYVVSTGKHSTTYTRIRTGVMAPAGTEFAVTKRSFFSKVGDVLGMQRIPVGNPSIDDNFVVKGKPDVFVKELLSDIDLAAQIAVQPQLDYRLINLGAAGHELKFIQVGIVKKPDRLIQLFALFALTLDRLQAMREPGEKSVDEKVASLLK